MEVRISYNQLGVEKELKHTLIDLEDCTLLGMDIRDLLEEGIDKLNIIKS